ncbi:MAG: hypothetical protein JWQ89_3694 [Devosia sp.]|uniref:nuclease domain-containing protein n=1 Tax=Devosia sp. TaxID=1871048 RepID=UPI00262E091D|nr:nuclease domain-containing protein [Devosia sp.]MDB5541967.1 hypothetical protein [Devosia sp.]
MTFKRPPPRPAKQWTADELPTPRAAVLYAPISNLTREQFERMYPGKPELKTPDRKSTAIRESARGEECTVRIVGACTHDDAMTIWSHAPFKSADKGGSIKSLDLCGAYCCTACDAVIDGQRPMPPGASRTSVMNDWFHGHMRSLVKLRQKGLA